MNRMEEYRAMLNELEQPAAGLDATLERACKRRRKAVTRMVTGPAAGLAACFAVFVLLVNFCAPVANACAKIPVLRELAEAVTFSPSLSSAVENEYVQPIGQTRTENGITAEIAYLIVDRKQVNVFYRLSSDQYGELEAHTEFACVDDPVGFSVVNSSFGLENGELRCVTVDFINEDVPARLKCRLKICGPDRWMTQEYLAEFDFLLEFDPQFTAAGKLYPVNQTIELGDQKITVTDIEVYPTHMRVNVAEAGENTAWLKQLYFYIETDRGMRFDTISNGISATGSADSPSMVSHRADSIYFYDAKHLKVVITGARWLDKDMETVYVDLRTEETGRLPEGVSLKSADRKSDGWEVAFLIENEDSSNHYILFGSKFYDADGQEYHITQWHTYGNGEKVDGDTGMIESFPLENYPYDEVWLVPEYSHCWTAENEIVIVVQ